MQLVDPSWKRGIDALVNAITRMGSSAMQFAQLATLPDISCPTCAQYSPLVDIAAATCATGQITLAKSGKLTDTRLIASLNHELIKLDCARILMI